MIITNFCKTKYFKVTVRDVVSCQRMPRQNLHVCHWRCIIICSSQWKQFFMVLFYLAYVSSWLSPPHGNKTPLWLCHCHSYFPLSLCDHLNHSCYSHIISAQRITLGAASSRRLAHSCLTSWFCCLPVGFYNSYPRMIKSTWPIQQNVKI